MLNMGLNGLTSVTKMIRKTKKSIISEQLASDLRGLTKIKIRTVRQGCFVHK